MRISADDIYKTAFCCHAGHFEFTIVPFGLKTAPNFFQREMNKIMAGLIGVCVFVYIDDILVFSKNEAEHTKCVFGLPDVKSIGYVLNKDGIQTDPDKVTTISNLPTPTLIKDVRSLLGITN